MTKSLFRSFAGGELTPEMYGRIDLSKFQTGLQKCLNFVTLPHGPAARRPGFRFAGYGSRAPTTTALCRLIPYSADEFQSFVLVFGPSTFVAYTNGALILEPNKTITAQSGTPVTYTSAGHGFTTGETVYATPVAGVQRAYRVLVTGANTFQLQHPITGAATTTAPVSLVSGTVARAQTTAHSFASGDLAILRYAQDGSVLTLTSGTAPMVDIEWTGSGWAVTTVSFTPTGVAPTGVTATATIPTATNPTAQKYVVTSLAADLVSESLVSVVATCNNNLTIQGNFNTISWTAAAGAARYYVYKLRGGVYGFIGQTTTLSLIDDNILPDTTVSPPENLLSLNTGSTDYPTAVSYFERRRWMAGVPAAHNAVYATRNAATSNLTSSIPSRSDDALSFKIAAQQLNDVQHLVPLTDLVALTNGAEFRIFSDGGPAITAETLSIKAQGFSGASDAQPVLTERSALFVQATGTRIRELAYDPNGTGAYRTTDMSILAPHLFNGYRVTNLAYVRAPEPTMWAVRSDGAMLGMTYVPDQQVYGWHQHTTPGGTILSLASVPEDGEDALYAAVLRLLPGAIYGLFIERLSSRQFTDQDMAFFVDSGLTYGGASTSTISGLDHLEGETVQVLADGAVVSERTVTAGRITLDTPASVVTVGLGYVSDLTTLPLAYEGAPAAGQAMRKNVNTVFLRVAQSSAAKAGPNFSELREYPARQVSDPWDSPPALRAAELDVSIDPSWNPDGAVCVRQDLPLPLTVVSIALDTATGG